MTTDSLYEFFVLSRTLNYSAAAENLYVSQSVLTKHIQDLENEIGAPLFIRSTHKVTLTPAGSYLAREVPGLLQDCEHSLQQLRYYDLPVSGTVRFGIIVEFSYARHIQDFLSSFMNSYKDIHLQVDVLSEGTPGDIIIDYDFILTPCIYPSDLSDIDSLLVRRHGVYAILYPGHPLLSKYLLQLKDLENERILVPFIENPAGPYASNWQMLRKYTHDKVQAYPTKNLASAIFMVSAHQGILLAPRYVKQILPDQLPMIGVSSDNCRFDEYLYFHKNTENGAAKLFLQEFKEALIPNT